MRLFRFGPVGAERPGVMLAGERVDASSFGTDWNEAFFAGDGLSRLAAWVRTEGPRAPRVPAGDRLGPAVARPSKLVCIGLNYRDHARETGAAIPTEPVIFMKATSAVAGPDDDVPLPAGSQKLDHEVELALVMARRAKSVTREAALEHVAGFVLHNDYSERAFQREHGGQWTKGKSCDGFAPLGPFLVTPDECPQVGAAAIWLKVNGEPRQTGSTADMIFDVPTLVSYVSQFMTLLPGDVLSTGTPAGVGMGRQPPLYLRRGDLVEYGVGGLGSARHRIA